MKFYDGSPALRLLRGSGFKGSVFRDFTALGLEGLGGVSRHLGGQGQYRRGPEPPCCPGHVAVIHHVNNVAIHELARKLLDHEGGEPATPAPAQTEAGLAKAAAPAEAARAPWCFLLGLG